MILIPRNSAASFPSATEIVRGLDQLPSAPKVIPRLMRLLDDGNSSLDEIGLMIRLDAGIAARLLRLANSIYYGKGERIISIDEAVTRIGYTQIMELVSYAAASQLLDRPLAAYGLSSDETWSMSVSCAFAAELLAAHCGEDCNIAYAIGLLHNVGMVVVNEYALQSDFAPRMIDAGFPKEWVDSERALLGYSQEELGAELLNSWDFPTSMSSPLRYQYYPNGSLGNRRMASLLHVAKWVRRKISLGSEGLALPSASSMIQLRLDAPSLMKIASEVRLRLLAARHLLESQQCVA